MKGILKGTRVLELGQMVAIPFAGRILAHLGADTIKVEPLSGDVSRRYGPFLGAGPSLDGGALFNYLNRGKSSLAIDLHTPSGRDALVRVARDADVVLADEWLLGEIGWEQGLRLLREDLPGIRIILTPFGLTGPHAKWLTSPLVAYHSGVYGSFIPTEPSRTMFPDRGPVAAGGFFGEYQCGAMAALPALAAILGKQGAFLELSRQETLISYVATEVERWPSLGRRFSYREPFHSFVGGVLPASDGYVSLVMMEDHQFRAAMRMFEHPAWSKDERQITQELRIVNWQFTYQNLGAETSKYTRDELFKKAQEFGVPLAPILDMRDISGQGMMGLEAGSFQQVEVEGRTLRWPGWPAEFAGERIPLQDERPAPKLGTDSVRLLEAAGYEREDLAAMQRFRIITAASEVSPCNS